MDYNKNYYQDLGLDKNCSQDDIKKKYRKLALQYHPDKNKTGNDDKFKEISAAYSVLSDTKQKQEYDQRSTHGNSYTPFNGFNGFNGGGFEFHFGGGTENDIFSQFFGKDSPFGNHFGFQREFVENLDINVNSTINLKQIYINENLKINFKRFLHCDDCQGTGFDKNSKSDICEVCDGTGRDNNKTCEYCRGDGKIYTGQCNTCKGEKVTLKDTEVILQNLFQIRGDIRNAHRGYGHQSKYYREKIGSLILNINIDRNDEFEIVNNYDLNKPINIHFQDAIDGTEIIFTHIDDTTIKIKLPKKSKNGDIIKIKEKGLLKNEKIRGDLYLKINIIIDYERI